MRLFRPIPLILVALLDACAGDAPVARSPSAAPPLPVIADQGLARVMGRDAATVIALLGQPALDLREGPARKLQFRGAACVLDAYLYPTPGGAARVTWIDARTPSGADFDRASCIAALVRR